jgi:uncharacterized protein related to proFAR isomerase
MELIPVIDVKGGRAVRAVRGLRADYRPLETPLASGSDPVQVARGLLSLYPFRTLYVADIDGIEGRGGNSGLLPRLTEEFPGIEIWLDNGSPGPQSQGVITVIGSESLTSADALPPKDFVLSLDFHGDAFRGPAALLADPSTWPERIIAMTLARVGSAEGPDLDCIAAIAARAGGRRRVYAAGGVRDHADVEVVRAAGASGALLATALHAGTITAGDLFEIAGR